MFPASFLAFMSGCAFVVFLAVSLVIWFIIVPVVKIIKSSRPAYSKPRYAPLSECREWDERSEYGKQEKNLCPPCMFTNMF